ncbi:MAG TPA: MauE/DoxX family redox-associated membrane protein [Castellaniella sp.]|nr:MauE/DoxX family redox-associated membrane protein [Castellaniella sp.]
MADPIIVYTALAVLAGILWLGALDKLRHFAAFEGAVAGYRLLPEAAQKPFAMVFVGAEVLVGILLLMPEGRVAGALGAMGILSVASLGVAINLLRGRTNIDCGCGGLGHTSTGLSWWVVGRNAMLVVLALVALTRTGQGARELVWVDGVTFFGAALAMLGLYLVLNQLIESHLRMQKNGSQS